MIAHAEKWLRLSAALCSGIRPTSSMLRCKRARAHTHTFTRARAVTASCVELQRILVDHSLRVRPAAASREWAVGRTPKKWHNAHQIRHHTVPHVQYVT